MRWHSLLAGLVIALSLTACDISEDTAELPPPAEVAGEATGYFCGMLLAEHGGPKGQIHLKSGAEPVWFSSVRDTVAFTLLEEEPKDIAAIYVNDMGKAQNWEQPEPGTWIDAHSAWFVIESRRLGGMGLPEAVPFGSSAAAERFAAENGGRVVRLADISADYVLGTPEMAPHNDAELGHATH
jgi:copper chaperone NosL